jgi:hypothetical protein
LHNNKYSYVFHCWDSHTPNTIEITHGGFLTQLLKQGDQKDPLHIPFIRIEIIFVHVDMILFELQDAFKKISEKYKLERIQSNIHENIGNYI